MDATAGFAAGISSEVSRLAERARRSVVQVENGAGGAGAGVVWPGEGPGDLVLTNAHVVSTSSRGASRREPQEVRLTTHDGRGFRAGVLRSDAALDLALLEVWGAQGLVPATPGDSGTLRVGELVIAVGHPWGRPGAATLGIVSGRPVRSLPEGPVEFIRSDVSLAPGNSGGPLLDSRGTVVGINAMVFGATALSIPSNLVRDWVASSSDGRARLGVGLRAVRLTDSAPGAVPGGVPGLLVAKVYGGSARRRGLRIGDVLLTADGARLEGVGDLFGALARGGPSRPVKFSVLRAGEVFEVEIGGVGSESAA